MKRRRQILQLTENQQLVLALVLVVLVAGSMLYCLGLASIALRQAWETAPIPWGAVPPPGSSTDMAPARPVSEPTAQATAAPLRLPGAEN